MPPQRDLSFLQSTSNSVEFGQLIKKYPNRTNIVAEGDSWFAYPPKALLFGSRSNVISHFKRKRRFNLLQMSSSGDEAVDMLSGKSKFRLLKVIDKHHVDYLMFSGGGNDVVGRYDFDFFLKNGVTSQNWRDYIFHDRLDRRLKQIDSAYRDLVEYCAVYSKNPDIKVVTHCYDYAVPSPKGAIFLGGLIKISKGESWMLPFMKNKGVPENLFQAIVNNLIDRMAEIFLKVGADYPNRMIVADTRNTLNPGEDWLNEIHPKPKGFGKIADVIFGEMFPSPD